MIQFVVEHDEVLINADREGLLHILDGIDQALDGIEWHAVLLSPDGVRPFRIKMSDKPETG